MGHGTATWLLHCVCRGAGQHCWRQLGMDTVGQGPYLQELGSYAGLTPFSLLPVPILLLFLDN